MTRSELSAADQESAKSDQATQRESNDGSRSSDARSERPQKEPGKHDEGGNEEEDQDQDEGKGDKDGDGDSDGKKSEEKANAKDEETRRKRRPFIIVLAIIVLLVITLGAVYYWLSSRNVESTDDAFTDGYVVQVAPQVSGRVVSLDITDNQFVKRGQAIIHLDPRPFINDRDQAQGQLDQAKAQLAGQKLSVEVARKNFPAALQVAEANLAAAKATLVQRQADFARQKSLPRQATTQQDVDNATSNLQNAQAQVLLMQARVVQSEPVQQQIGETEKQVAQLQGMVEQAQSRLDQANLNLSYTVVKAAQDGWITRRQTDKGNYVQAGQQILNIVSPDVWVTANFKETQLDLMRPGQSVEVHVDAYPDLNLHGHVDSIQLGSGSKFSAFPAENATGNFVKIVQRVPVKILIDSGLDPSLPLPLGISVEPRVTVR